MSKKRILVTGGAGFIGSNFCNHHLSKYDVVALDNLFLGDPENLSPSVTFVEGDAADKATLDSLGSFDYIVHFAGTSSAPMFDADLVKGYTNSIVSFLEVLEFARRTNVKKVLYASTSSLYGNRDLPLTEEQHPVVPNHYSVTKVAMENIAECFHRTHPELDIIGFRFMSVYGPHEEHKGVYANLISQFTWGMMRGEQPVVYGDGTQTRDFTNVMDVVQGITLAMESTQPLGNNVFNIGTSKSINLLTLIATINSVLDTSIEPKLIPNPIKENYIKSQQADISKIQSTLGYNQTVNLEEGITQIVTNLNSRTHRSVRDRSHQANQVPVSKVLKS